MMMMMRMLCQKSWLLSTRSIIFAPSFLIILMASIKIVWSRFQCTVSDLFKGKKKLHRSNYSWFQWNGRKKKTLCVKTKSAPVIVGCIEWLSKISRNLIYFLDNLSANVVNATSFRHKFKAHIKWAEERPSRARESQRETKRNRVICT